MYTSRFDLDCNGVFLCLVFFGLKTENTIKKVQFYCACRVLGNALDEMHKCSGLPNNRQVILLPELLNALSFL